MADNVAITAGSGTTIATDEVAVNGGTTAHVQYVKIVDGTGNGTDGIQGTATNGLEVDVTRIIPGVTATALGKQEDAAHVDGDTGVMMLGVRNHGGVSADGDYAPLSITSDGNLRVDIHRELVRISVQSAGLTTATTSYSAGDQMGNQFTITDAARVSGGSGTITGVTLVCAATNIGAVDVVFFDSSVTLAADNAAFSISDADALKVVAVVPLAGTFAFALNRVAQATNIAIPYVCSGSANLYAGLITRNTHTFFGAATDLQLIVYAERN